MRRSKMWTIETAGGNDTQPTIGTAGPSAGGNATRTVIDAVGNLCPRQLHPARR